MKESLIKQLNLVLVDTYSLYLKTQCYHWNVSGTGFLGIHQMLEGQYRSLADTIDEIAEHMRALGHKVPAGFDLFSKVTTLKNGNPDYSSLEMIKDLASDHASLEEQFKQLAILSEKMGDHVVAGFSAQRMEYHRKTAWLISSHI